MYFLHVCDSNNSSQVDSGQDAKLKTLLLMKDKVGEGIENTMGSPEVVYYSRVPAHHGPPMCDII